MLFHKKITMGFFNSLSHFAVSQLNRAVVSDSLRRKSSHQASNYFENCKDKTSMISKKCDFYEKIGRPKFVVAPMVQQSELAFRLLCRQHGATLAFTPMIHSKLFSEPRGHNFRKENFDGLGPDITIDRPLIAQFCGNKPGELLNAAQYIEDRVDGVDINFGCPQAIARKGRYGAFLLTQPDLCEELVSVLASSLRPGVATTVKMRCLPTIEETIEFAKRMETAGAQLLTVHGRTVKQSKTEAGAADWEAIRILKSELSIPVIANGGIEHFGDVHRCLVYTAADAVMSSEALLENPMIFKETESSPAVLEALTGQQWAHRQLKLVFEYLSIIIHHPTSPGIFKAHCFKLLYRLFEIHKDIRNEFGSNKVFCYNEMTRLIIVLALRYGYPDMDSAQIILESINKSEGLQQYLKKGEQNRPILHLFSESEVSTEVSSCSWYKRHRAS